ncbi:MAG: N-formylglutamate deformylase [Planctomycetota bacterium]
MQFRVREPEAPLVPLLASIPHCGTEVPGEIAARFASAEVSALPDTDWHLHDLYDFVPELGARTIFARYSRYVVDLNRPADGHALYPGREETSVVPAQTFSGEPVYRAGEEPGPEETRARIEHYWRPYHDRLREELDRLRERFGYALLFDAHSIQSRVPRLFEGELPGFMLGDVDGASASTPLSRAILAVQEASGISFEPNHPFKGGYITRCFGRPESGIHAVQLEMSQRLYMAEGAPFKYLEARAQELRPWLRRMLRSYVEAAGASLS